jgi:hypothetical protein
VDPALENGTSQGQIVVLMGTDDANTVTINDNVNTQLAGDAAFTLGDGDTLTLIWSTSKGDWVEIARSSN